MSRFFPHTEYAEDQPWARTVLTYHVLDRGFQSGAFFGLVVVSVRSLFRHSRPFQTIVLGSTGYGAIIGTALMIPGLPGYMASKTDIEWKDRSWRLLENEGQMQVDDWSNAGLVVGTLAAARSPAVRQAGRLSVVKLTGGAAIGNLVGVMGYMVWRYGMKGGVWAEKA